MRRLETKVMTNGHIASVAYVVTLSLSALLPVDFVLSSFVSLFVSLFLCFASID